MSDAMTSSADRGRVLLIGDIQKALLDPVQVDRYPCEVRTSILEGIDAAARGRFAAIGIVMAGTTPQLGPALKALRDSTKAKILLLAQMHEEPIARRFVETGPEEKLADAYLVCPTCLASLCSHASTPKSEDGDGDGRAMAETPSASAPWGKWTPSSGSGTWSGWRRPTI
jgi:hypothetical protein